ncbi:MAG: nuclear transport factor 2 family protein [Lysobacterales bacterium]
MNNRLIALALVLGVAAPLAWAHGKEKHLPAQTQPGRDISGVQQQIAPDMVDAVAAVERFSTALGRGELDKAALELDPNVLILESGGVERTRAEYMGGHAKADAAFLKDARVTVKQRQAHVSADMAWVGSESEIHAKQGAEMLMISSTETMVLRKTSAGWKITHIHWSSRRADGSH